MESTDRPTVEQVVEHHVPKLCNTLTANDTASLIARLNRVREISQGALPRAIVVFSRRPELLRPELKLPDCFCRAGNRVKHLVPIRLAQSVLELLLRGLPVRQGPFKFLRSSLRESETQRATIFSLARV